jgi:membrane glycosyltransferase
MISTGALKAASDGPDCIPGAVSVAWLPAPAPLAMAAQDLKTHPGKPRDHDPRLHECDLWRAAAFGLTLLAMFAAGVPCREVLQVDGFTPVEMAAFAIFELLFGWVTFSLVITLFGVAGAVAHEPELVQLKPETPLLALTRRTAILAPIHNEEPACAPWSAPCAT